KAARVKKGYSQTELAELLGYKSRSSINKIEKEGRDIPRSIIVRLAELLDVTPAYLMGWEEESIFDKYPQIEPIPEMRKIPLLGAIACGKPIYKEKNEWISLPTDIKADFCLRCEGDSMINARIYDGDIVFIKSCPEVENGQIAAVSIDNEVTLKRVYYYKDKNKLVLSPENPNYEPFVYMNEELDDIRILGKAVMFLSAVK
ncbi:MAG: LexA family protein, partial [Acutalibacteraceae bacterium]